MSAAFTAGILVTSALAGLFVWLGAHWAAHRHYPGAVERPRPNRRSSAKGNSMWRPVLVTRTSLEIAKLSRDVVQAAFKKANVPDEAALAAAEEIAGLNSRLTKVEADLNLLKWMVATNIVLTITMALLLY